jgi:hypothetical protein
LKSRRLLYKAYWQENKVRLVFVGKCFLQDILHFLIINLNCCHNFCIVFIFRRT